MTSQVQQGQQARRGGKWHALFPMALKVFALLVSLTVSSAGLAEKADLPLKLLAKKALQKKGLPFQKAMAVVKGIAEEDRRKAAYPDDDGSCPDEYSNYYSWCVPNCT